MRIRGSICGSGYTWWPRSWYGVDPGLIRTGEGCEEGKSSALVSSSSSDWALSGVKEGVDLFGVFRRLCHDCRLIEREHAPILHHHFAANDGRPHIGGLECIDDGRIDVIHRSGVRSAGIHHDEIGLLAHFQRADLPLKM